MFGVVKIGGAPGNGAENVLRDLAERVGRGERWALVHGASGAMDGLCRSAGVEVRHVVSPSGFRSRFVGEGERELFEAAAARVSLEHVQSLGELGVRGVSLWPREGSVTGERKEVLRAVESGRCRLVRGNWSGTVRHVDPAPLRRAWSRGEIPVLPPLAQDGVSGRNLNVDGDRLAAAVAVALGAEALVILSNVPGLLRDPQDPDSLVASGDLEDWGELEEMARGNMKRKLQACREALEGGVPRVLLGDSRGRRPLEEVLAGRGTELCRARATALAV
jgi:acetylglutamate/LysW-gamma-L-alpha-aminoadipate kinase